MRKIVITLLLLLFVSVIAFAWFSFSKQEKKSMILHEPAIKPENTISAKALKLLRVKAVSAREFAKQNKFDTAICFLIDMRLPSNQKRFFIYNLEKDSILSSGLVTHGNCNQYWLDGRKYGNTVGCGCTSLGKYKIGNSYYGRFGLAFKLHGLDKTNSNAYRRYVVLHSHECVPDTEIKEDICQSNGCPTVSPSFLKELQLLIKNAKRPVLLWIYDQELQ